MELETHLIVACNLHLVDSDSLEVISREVKVIGKMLNGLIGALKARKARF
jgi:hypothetical protein